MIKGVGGNSNTWPAHPLQGTPLRSSEVCSAAPSPHPPFFPVDTDSSAAQGKGVGGDIWAFLSESQKCGTALNLTTATGSLFLITYIIFRVLLV